MSPMESTVLQGRRRWGCFLAVIHVSQEPMQNFRILRNPLLAERVMLSREKKNKQKIVAYISCFTGQKHFARAKNSPPGWEEGSTNLFLPNISCKSKPHAKFHSPRNNHSHPKQDKGKRHREREKVNINSGHNIPHATPRSGAFT